MVNSIEIIDDQHAGFAKVSLDHRRALEKEVDEGGYARAAEALGKSQSTVSHSIQRLEQLLGTQLLRIQGRRAGELEAGLLKPLAMKQGASKSADLHLLLSDEDGAGPADVSCLFPPIWPAHAAAPGSAQGHRAGHCAHVISKSVFHTRISEHDTVFGRTKRHCAAGGEAACGRGAIGETRVDYRENPLLTKKLGAITATI